MSEELNVSPDIPKDQKYRELLPQLKALIVSEKDVVANLSNISAALHQTFGWWWVGFYLVKDGELVLGPFQGPVACTRIKYGKGVCGAAWKNGSTLLVPDVNEFPGHIACSSLSVCEIVVPVFAAGEVVGVLDVDSEKFNTFDAVDQHNLEEICKMISEMFIGKI